MGDTLLAFAPTTTTTSGAATVTTTATASAATSPPTPQPAAPEQDKSLLGGAPNAKPSEASIAEKLYGKLVDKVVTDGDKKAAPEPAKAEEKKLEPAKPEAAKPAEGTAPTETKYDLKAPDGSMLAPADVEKVTSLAKEAKLSPEVAQKVLDAQSRTVTEYRDRLLGDFQKQSQQWVTDLKADKEFGGEKFSETVESAKRAFHAYAGPELVKLMNDTGYGNHPEVIKMFARIGKPLADGRFVQGGQPVVAKKRPEDILYGGTMGKK
jgi:hypothetical protein